MASQAGQIDVDKQRMLLQDLVVIESRVKTESEIDSISAVIGLYKYVT